MSTKTEDQERLADLLMQRMAQHAPVTQRYSADGRWLLIWGNGAVGEEGATRFEAVMKIMEGLISASPVADPRIAAPSHKKPPGPDEGQDNNPGVDVQDADSTGPDPVGDVKEASLDVDKASDDDNGPA